MSYYSDKENVLKNKIDDIKMSLRSLPKGTDPMAYDQLNGELDSLKTQLKDLRNSIGYNLEESLRYGHMQHAFEEAIEFFNSCKCCDRHQCNKPSCSSSNIRYQLNECELCADKFPNHKSYCCLNPNCGKFFCRECLDKYDNTSNNSNKCPYCRIPFTYSHMIICHKTLFAKKYNSWNRLDKNACRCGCRRYARKLLRLRIKASKKKNLSVIDCQHYIGLINDMLDLYYTRDIPMRLSKYISFEKFVDYQKRRFESLSPDTKITIGQMRKYKLIMNHEISCGGKRWNDELWKHVTKIIRENPYMTLSDYIQNIEMFFEPFLAF